MFVESPARLTSYWLVDRVMEVKRDIIERSYLTQPMLGSELHFRVRPLSRRSVHLVGAVEVGHKGVGRKYFAKAALPDYAGTQRIGTEAHILADVAPKICRENPRTSSPQLLAYYPEHSLLVMEFVDGESLKSLLFDIGFKNPQNLPKLLRLTGEWLSRLHSVTIQTQHLNPFDWLRQEFARDSVKSKFVSCSLGSAYDQLVDMVEEFCERLPDLRRPLCEIHGEFTPLHVLVNKDRIYVIDFASSRLGLPYEDLAMFTTFFETLLPWRTFSGNLRLPLQEQKSFFTEAYFMDRAHAFDAFDDCVLRFARILAFTHYVGIWENVPRRWSAAMYAQVGRSWIRRRFASVCSQEVGVLRQSLFNLHQLSRPFGIYNAMIESQTDG